jgi:hypothetical protein
MRKEKWHVSIIIMAALIVTASAFAATPKEKKKKRTPPKPNTLNQREVKQGFTLLFDGKSLEHFKGIKSDAIPAGAWIVKGGQIICTPRKEGAKGARGSIVTKEQYANFDFRFQYKLDTDFEGAVNSGIKYFSYLGAELGLEYQLYDHDKEIKGAHAVGDLYDLLPATERPAKPRGKWNRVRIVAKGKNVEHWLNNKKILSFERGSEAFRAAVAKSKFKKHERFGEADQGPIILQDHGGGIAFRNIKIKVD